MKIRGRINNNAYEVQGQIFEHSNKIIVILYYTDALYNGHVMPFRELYFDNQYDFEKWILSQEFIKKIDIIPFLKVAKY